MKIKNLFKNNNYELIISSFFSAISSLIKIGSTFLVGKILAIYFGPQGLALIGQLLNFTLIITVLSGNSISQGLTKYISEYNSSSKEAVNKYIRTAFSFYVISSAVVGVFIVLFSHSLAKWILYDKAYYYVFVFYGVILIFSQLNNLALSILNGYRAYKLFNLLNSVSNILYLVTSVLFIYFFKLKGALLAMIFYQVLFFIFIILLLKKENIDLFPNFKIKVEEKELRQLLQFGLLALFSIALPPFFSIYSRDLIIKNLSIEDAGMYELVLRISNSCLFVFSMIITTYYISKISETKEVKLINKEIVKMYTLIIPIMMLLLLLIFLLRTPIIEIIASEKFLQSEKLFKYQLLGEFFRICAQVLSFILVAKAWIKEAILIECFFNIFYVVMLKLLISRFGIIGASINYFLIYFTYFVFFMVYYKLRIIKKI